MVPKITSFCNCSAYLWQHVTCFSETRTKWSQKSKMWEKTVFFLTYLHVSPPSFMGWDASFFHPSLQIKKWLPYKSLALLHHETRTICHRYSGLFFYGRTPYKSTSLEDSWMCVYANLPHNCYRKCVVWRTKKSKLLKQSVLSSWESSSDCQLTIGRRKCMQINKT